MVNHSRLELTIVYHGYKATYGISQVYFARKIGNSEVIRLRCVGGRASVWGHPILGYSNGENVGNMRLNHRFFLP